MKKFVLPLALGALVLGAMVGAKADPVQKPWSVQVGASWPGNGQAKHDEGSTVVNAGLDYAIAKTGTSAPALPSIYFDYAGGSDHGGSLNSYGVGVAVRAYGTNPAGNTSIGMSPYYGAGVGAYWTQDKDNGTSKTDANIGGKIFAGLEFSGSYFVQVGYDWLPKSQGADPSNLGVDVGLRF